MSRVLQSVKNFKNVETVPHFNNVNTVQHFMANLLENVKTLRMFKQSKI